MGAHALGVGGHQANPTTGKSARAVAASPSFRTETPAAALLNGMQTFERQQDGNAERAFQRSTRSAARRVVSAIISGFRSNDANAQVYEKDSIWLAPNPGANQNELTASWTPGKGNTGIFEVSEINQDGGSPNVSKNKYTSFETEMEVTGPVAAALNHKLADGEALTPNDFTALANDKKSVTTFAQVEMPSSDGSGTTITVTDTSHNLREQTQLPSGAFTPNHQLTYPGLSVAVQDFDRSAGTAQTEIAHDMRAPQP